MKILVNGKNTKQEPVMCFLCGNCRCYFEMKDTEQEITKSAVLAEIYYTMCPQCNHCARGGYVK